MKQNLTPDFQRCTTLIQRQCATLKQRQNNVTQRYYIESNRASDDYGFVNR